jgi:LysR family transcriptional regulator, low CO2-responsive transcriptional regulator
MHPLANLTLRQLRAFAATVASGSQTVAAQTLGVTQPAVTLQLQNLQDLAGLPLLQRTPEGPVATEAGRALLELDARVKSALDDCLQALKAIKGLSGGRVVIGAVSTAKYFVPAAIGAFARRYPHIEMKLTIGNRSEIMQALRDYTLDVAITGRPPSDMDIERRLVGDHPNIIIAPADHPLARRKALKLTDLASEFFLVREQGSGTRLLMQTFVDEFSFRPKIGMEIDSNETIKQAVMAGLGIAFISAHTVASEIQHGRLAVLDVVGLPMIRQWFVIRRVDKHLLPPAQALMEFLSREAVRFLPNAIPSEPTKRRSQRSGPKVRAE